MNRLQQEVKKEDAAYYKGMGVALLMEITCFLAAWFWPVTAKDPPVEIPIATCWKDSHPERVLDFDFYTGIEGKPNRCGYLPSTALPIVLSGRAVDDDLECYPLARVTCK